MQAHRTVVYKKFSVEEVLKFVDTEGFVEMNVDGQMLWVYIHSLKLQMFKKNLSCANCGIAGEYFQLEQEFYSDKLSSRSRVGACYVEGCMHCHPYGFRDRGVLHFNLYGVRERTGNTVLLTMDHVKPKSKGGGNELSNLQTMCEKCNRRKGDS